MNDARGVQKNGVFGSPAEIHAMLKIANISLHHLSTAGPQGVRIPAGKNQAANRRRPGQMIQYVRSKIARCDLVNETLSEPSTGSGNQDLIWIRAHSPRTHKAFMKWRALRLAMAMMLPCGFTPGAVHSTLASFTKRFGWP